MEFTFRGIRFNILPLRVDPLDQRRVQLWVQNGDGTWEIGHSKPVPEDMPIIDAVWLMHDFMVGTCNPETYERMMPSEATCAG